MNRFHKQKNGGKNIINPQWPGYVRDLVLKALKSFYDQKETIKVHLSSGKFPNSMEISFYLT